MNGLSGTRVIVVDDDEKEALPMLKGLSKLGISSTYFDGTRTALPLKSQRLVGVRLAILDMDLLDGGVSSDKSKVSTLLMYVMGILRPDNGPYGVLVWTKHPELQELFEETMFTEPNIPNPVFVSRLTKTECKDIKGNLNIKLILSKIQTELNSFSPLLLLQVWEENSHKAATMVTNALSALTSNDTKSLAEWRSAWNTQFLQLLHAMAEAEAGKQLDANLCLNALYGSLNPLHSDRMESNNSKVNKSLSPYSAEIMNSSSSKDIRAKAKLNTMLHLAVDETKRFYAGNIYLDLSQKWAHVPSIEEVLDDFMNCKENQKDAYRAALEPVSKSVIVEVNASCDHSQNNIRIARFVAGILIPATEKAKIKKAEFILKFGPVFLDDPLPAGEYYFFFSARHVITIELEKIKNKKAFLRMRGQAFTDLQAWLARQTSRPGMLMLLE